ncbi:Pycsar system effector family protein [Vibrio lentus]
MRFIDLAQFVVSRFVVSRFDGFFNNSNVKASLLIPANALIIGTAISVFMSISEKALISSPERVVLTLAIFLSLIATFFSLKVVFSFLDSGNKMFKYHSMIYFGSISSFSEDDFVERVKNTKEDDIEEDLARQMHVLSRGLTRKFENVNKSVIFTGLSFLSLASLGLLIIWG